MVATRNPPPRRKTIVACEVGLSICMDTDNCCVHWHHDDTFDLHCGSRFAPPVSCNAFNNNAPTRFQLFKRSMAISTDEKGILGNDDGNGSTTPHFEDMIGWLMKNNKIITCSTRLSKFLRRSLPNDRLEISNIWGSGDSPYMKTIRAIQVERHFAYLIQRNQHEIITKHLNYCKVLCRNHDFATATVQAY